MSECRDAGVVVASLLLLLQAAAVTFLSSMCNVMCIYFTQKCMEMRLKPSTIFLRLSGFCMRYSHTLT